MKTLKLHVLLAKTDTLASSFKGMIKDYIKFFKDNQGAFRGERKTYIAKPGTIDQPSQRGNRKVTTTVNEKMEWFTENSKEYIDALFSQEKTNSTGKAIAELKVDGESWGEFTSLELLRLKSLIEHGELLQLFEKIPVRSDSDVWEESSNEMYQGREIFESPLQEGISKSTLKEAYILEDPNIDRLKDASNYKPVTATKDTIIELGEYTFQRFSGEWSHRQRAELLKRRQKLLVAVIEALKVANESEVVESELSANRIFNYLLDIS